MLFLRIIDSTVVRPSNNGFAKKPQNLTFLTGLTSIFKMLKLPHNKLKNDQFSHSHGRMGKKTNMENTNENQANNIVENTPVESVETEKNAQPKETKNIDWKITAIILAAGLAIALGLLGFYIWNQNASAAGKENQTKLTAQDASKMAVDYINKYYAQENAQASISQVKEGKIDGLYEFTIDMQGQKINAYVTADGKMLFPTDPIDLTMSPEEAAAKAQAEADAQNQTAAQTTVESQPSQAVDGNFTELTSAEPCQENGKPIIYFFGSESCPHCKWEQPVISAVAKKFGSAINYHENVDNGKEMDVFSQYSDGGVPTLVLGCKYYRVGSGESSGKDSETATLTKLICNLTGNQPGEICGK